MDSPRRKTSSILAALRVPFRSRRTAAQPARVACEALEGRQLLTGGTPLPGSMPMQKMVGSVDADRGAGPSATTSGAASDPGANLADSSRFERQYVAEMTGSGELHAGPTMLGGPSGSGGPRGGDGLTMSSTMVPLASGASNDFPGGGSFRRDGGHDGGGMGFGDHGPGGSLTPPTGSGQDNTALAAALKKLGDDQRTIHDKSEVTPALLASVRKDLEAIDAARTTAPDPTALQTLQTDTETLRASAIPTDDQVARVQADATAVFLGEGVSRDLIDRLNADLLAVKTASNVTADDLNTLAADRAAVEAATGAARPAPTSGTDATTTAASTSSATPAAIPAATAQAATDPTGPAAAADDSHAAATTTSIDTTATTTAATSGTTTPVVSTKQLGRGASVRRLRGMGGLAHSRMTLAFRGGGRGGHGPG